MLQAWKVAVSIPDKVIDFFFFNLTNRFSLNMSLGLTQPVTDMSMKNLSVE
jgi:hypothetical protein